VSYLGAQQAQPYVVSKKQDQVNTDMPVRHSQAFEVIVVRCVTEIKF
jgi:hypothetical protein